MTQMLGPGGSLLAMPPAGDVLLADPLRDALLESRERWRDLMRIAADVAFETDAEGRFVFLSPATIVGWRAEDLIGESSDKLLADMGDIAGFSPFRASAAIRNRRVWLRRPDGELCWMGFSAAPMLNEAGTLVGVRGVARDATEFDRTEAAMARELRRAELVDHIVWYMRTEILAPRMMQKALLALIRTLGADGAMIVESDPDIIARGLQGDEPEQLPPDLLHVVGGDVRSVRSLSIEHLRLGVSGPALLTTAAGHACVLCATPTRFEGCAGLVIWRADSNRAWEADDLSLLAATIGTIRVLLEVGAIQQEMARQARTDALTGLFNRRAFGEEVTRRLDRLERDKLPGTLLFVDIDNFKTLNDQCGHAAGDEGLKIVATLLRDATRPGDVVARIGGDEFALWFDGMDHLAAAERSEGLRLKGPYALARLGDRPLGLSLSIGIATRWPGSGLDTEALLRRADDAMYEAKRAGKSQWRLWTNETGDVF